MSVNWKQVKILIKQYIKTNSLLFNIISFAHLGSSNTATSIIASSTQLKAYKKIKRKYTKNIFVDLSNKDINKKESPAIWIFWYQGFDEAPELVKICYKSVKKNFASHKIILIDKNNIANYVSFPSFIYEKVEKGIISITHFSDILRLALLSEYGGIWIDSTVFFTTPQNVLMEEKMKKIINSDFFIFRSLPPSNSCNCSKISSWFIVSKKKSPIVTTAYNILLKYWEKENSLIDYYLLHLCLMLSIELNDDVWKDTIILDNGYPHLLQFLFLLHHFALHLFLLLHYQWILFFDY